jgi:hypothetical protein
LAHAKEQAIARYGQTFNHGRLLEKINAGEARLVRLAHQGRLFYDVSYRSEFNSDIIVRVLVNAEKTAVISIVPPQTQKEIKDASVKAEQKKAAKRRQRLFREFKGVDDDEFETA